jgi:putative transcriptional regulator
LHHFQNGDFALPERFLQERRMNSPTPAEILAARKAAGLTQSKAAALVYRSLNSWQRWEIGDRTMPPGLWELFLNKTGITR